MQTIKVIVLGINIFAVLGLMSLILPDDRTNEFKIIEVLEDIRDTKEFIREDLFNERIDSAAATSYINVLDDAEDKLIQLLK
jgi:hypothetical protein